MRAWRFLQARLFFAGSYLDAHLTKVLKLHPVNWLEAYPVDKRVENVRNNDVGLIEPLLA